MAEPPKAVDPFKIPVSFEIGKSYQPIEPKDGGLPGLDAAQNQVFACLVDWRSDIEFAERDFHVSRLAIAGAIAWEMLENVRTSGWRSTGFGKVHTFNFKWAFWKAWDTAAKQAETKGYLPPVTDDKRKELLSNPSGAIRYIGGIMAAIAEITAWEGFGDIRNDPIILTNVYQSKDLVQWEEHLKKKPKGSTLSGGNPMDIWVGENIAFLTAAVGTPNPLGEATRYVSQSDPTTSPGAKILTILKNHTLSGIAYGEYGSWELWPQQNGDWCEPQYAPDWCSTVNLAVRCI